MVIIRVVAFLSFTQRNKVSWVTRCGFPVHCYTVVKWDNVVRLFLELSVSSSPATYTHRARLQVPFLRLYNSGASDCSTVLLVHFDAPLLALAIDEPPLS